MIQFRAKEEGERIQSDSRGFAKGKKCISNTYSTTFTK